MSYAYKYVRDYLPPFVKDAIVDYEGTVDYDGDQWYATEEYIKVLEKELVYQYNLTEKFENKELLDWLMTREKTGYCDGPAFDDKNLNVEHNEVIKELNDKLDENLQSFHENIKIEFEKIKPKSALKGID